ncbi:hypothetical protein ACN47E_009745 [Coniothyrium glycines]
MYQYHQNNDTPRQLSILNHPPQLLRGPALLHDLVPFSSDVLAIDFLENGSKRRKLTFETLHSLSNALAERISRVSAELASASPIIPILLPQCPELYIVLLAVLKAGKAFCPLNLDTPTERFSFILEDVAANLVITSPAHVDKLPTAAQVRTFLVDDELEQCNTEQRGSLSRPSTDDLAYVLYTSGSTGLPKAVSVSHRAATQSLLAHDRHIPSFTRFLQFAAPTFDVSIFEIFFPWFRGRTLVGCTRAQMLDDLPRTIRCLEADAAELTPTVASNLLQGRKSVPGLKLLLTIGEMLTSQVVKEYGSTKDQVGILWAMYGPTEAAIHCTLQAAFSDSHPIGSIGTPLDTVSTYIIAPSFEESSTTRINVLPVGIMGELAIGGPQVAEEYLNRPQLTNVAFVDHPDYGRLYRTGDKAKQNEDGTLECFGRVVAGQVKLRGQRIELGEIEQIISKIDTCRATIAMVIDDRLIAFCATRHAQLSRFDVLEVCKTWLPSFMVPSDIFFVDYMPQLPSGKIDKKVLEARATSYKSDALVTNDSLQPNDATYETVHHILSNYIQSPLRMNSRLEFLGLDSLQAIRIASSLRLAGYGLGALDVLETSTPEELVALCKKVQLTNGQKTMSSKLADGGFHEDINHYGISIEDVARCLPCTPLQEAMLSETTAQPNAYCNWVELEVFHQYTHGQIVRALQSLVEKNEVLRTGFLSESNTSSTFVQVIWRTLPVTQIQHVSLPSKSYTLHDPRDLLYPFKAQIYTIAQRPRILLQIHHALYDGWTMDLILHDLHKLLRSEPVSTRPQFGDVTRYLNDCFSDVTRDSARDYWTGFLQDHVPTILPNLNAKLVPKSQLQIHLGRSKIDFEQLSGRARDLSVNPQVFFQAATACVLGLYTGSSDILIGNVASGRAMPVTGVENIMGPCIATLPFRLDLKNLTSVRDILRRTQRVNRESLQHFQLPLRNIAKAAGLQPGTRLFDLLFVWQQSLQSDICRSLDLKIVASMDHLEFPLTLEYEPQVKDIGSRATFDRSVISEQQVDYMLRQIDQVVLLFLKDTECRISDLKKCFTDDLISISNPNPPQVCFKRGPADAVERWASKDPDRIAVMVGQLEDGAMKLNASVTYQTLNTSANQLAHLLASKGIKGGELIAIVMDKTVDLYVSILAVLKLGCGYLPLVPDTPLERIGAIFHDAQITMCISQSSVSSNHLAKLPTRILDFDKHEIAKYCRDNLRRPYQGHHIAYAVFTSGSTGMPKGVLVTQDNLMSNLQHLASIYPYTKESKLLQSCSQAFDVSVFEIFFSWHVGICLCTAKNDDLFHDFEAAINFLQITHLSLTPTVAALVEPDNVPRVGFLVTAGEAVTEIVKRKWSGRGLYQGYGPSETTNICTVRPAVTADDLINNIGSAFANTSAFVLDPASHNILPRGAVGELCFGGSQVFRGYLNRPDLNATKLIHLPNYGRIYRSGDMGRMLPDNSILFTGRSDDQVKIRGQRVELGEITSCLLDNPEIRDCITLLYQHDGGRTSLISFWVPGHSQIEAFECLDPRQYVKTITDSFSLLTKRLPSYMLPSNLIPVSRLPMTAQSKVDKRGLMSAFAKFSKETLDATSLGHDTVDVADIGSEWEQYVAGVLAQILDLGSIKIPRNSSFFSLGLDSVSAIQFSGRLRRIGLGDFSVSEVLTHPSLAQLTTLKANIPLQKPNGIEPNKNISQLLDSDESSQIKLQYKRLGLQVARILPCTPLQEAMLSVSRAESGPAYCNVTVFDVKGDLGRLRQCWEHMFLRHEIFRTSFTSTNNPTMAYAQVILENVDVYWRSHELSDDLQVHVARAITDRLNENKPPVYMAISRTELATKLLLCCHHALYDGIAVATLLQEVEQTYLGGSLPPAVKFDQYLAQMVSQQTPNADRYWSTAFAGFEPSVFPNLSGKTSTHQYREHVLHTMAVHNSDVLKACQSASVSLLSVVHATWAKLLHFYTGEHDLCFGNVVSGRSIAVDGLDRLVAPCFNTLPIRVNFDFTQTNSSLVKLTHDLNISMLAYQLTPLRRIQSLMMKEGGRLFDTLVILQQPAPLLNTEIWTIDDDLGDMDLPIVCEIIQDLTSDTLNVKLHYRSSLLAREDAIIVARTFEASFETMLNDPGSAANSSTHIPSHLLATSNLDFRPFSVGSSLLHSGFERNSAMKPDHPALEFLHPNGHSTIWSYKTLNAIANGIAHVLIASGIQAEDIVPIHMFKCPHYYASILGILKAGGAFAPIHPDLPITRKRYMLADLSPKIILCSNQSIPEALLSDTTFLDVTSIEIDQGKQNPLVDELHPSDQAYCLFTSGSTGVPKAVSVEHQAPIQTIASSRSRVPWKPTSRLLQFAEVTFDMCYYDCFLAWTLGITLCAADQSELINDLTTIIKTLKVDLLDLTPSVAAALRRSDLPSVNWLYCIGEAMSPSILLEWKGACVNSYGPTESAFCTTIYQPEDNASTAVIGKPFPTTSFAVFAPNGLRPLPVLSIGELYIGGSQLARAYLGRPELTDERFVVRIGQRFYKSGDLVRMLADGNFEFMGRTDDQVKIRGLRVELGEITSVLEAHSAVAAAVSQIIRQHSEAKEQLVAFVVLHDPLDSSQFYGLERELKHAVADHLPAYMVPSFFVRVQRIPRSMAGKVDRKALIEEFQRALQEREHMDRSTEHSLHEWTDLQSMIRDILASLSQVDYNEISSETTIYQLGLDSISAVQISTALRKRGYLVQAGDVMKYTTCKDIAAYLEHDGSKQASVTHFDFVAFEKNYEDVVLQAHGMDASRIAALRPCTALQKGMISQFIAKEGAVYMNYIRFQLQVGTHVESLRDAWNRIMQRHPMLRTGFLQIEDTSYPIVMVQYEPNALSLPWVSTFASSGSVSAEDWLHEAQQTSLTALHLPPWQLRHISYSDGDYLEIAMFHGLFDARGLQIILDDVFAAYYAEKMPPPTSIDATLSSILVAGAQENNKAVTFWKQAKSHISPTRFPNLAPLRSASTIPTVCAKQSTRSLADLERGCRDANITLQAAGLASWLSILSAYTGENAVACGIVLSGRTTESAESTAFPCINTVPIGCDMSFTAEELLERIMTMTIDVQQYQSIPLPEIQKIMGYPNEPLFDTLFAYQKFAAGGHDNLWKTEDERASVEYPISIELEPIAGRLKYRLTFMPYIIPVQQAESLLSQLDHYLNFFVSNASHVDFSTRFLDMSIYSVTPARRPSLPSNSHLLHELVEHSAISYPQRVAFVFASTIKDGTYDGMSWTFSELDAQGNRIAHLLTSHGIGSGDLVGVCFEKCPEASFAILGILKSGSAFVAIDPGAPAARQAFIAKDAQVSAVLSMSTQSAKFKDNVETMIINLDEVSLQALPTTKPNLVRNIDPQDRSYCLYTSGTTGTPKGCELTHDNATQALSSFSCLFEGHWNTNSRWLQFASFHFDVSVLEQYWSWSVGICVMSAPRDLIFEDLAGCINALKITHIDLTPSLAQLLHPDDVPTLCDGVFITGGESLKQEILDVWGPKSVIYNGYGPTEATIGCTMYPRVPSDGKPTNIGRQFPNVGTYVLLPSTDIPVVRGGIGELCVSGKLVGKGYLNRPELTKERFPFLERFGERVYRTGDLVRILHDETFEFLGRADDQVKLRGQRLEMGEINSTIKQSMKDISDVVTLVLKHTKQLKDQLVSFVAFGQYSKAHTKVAFDSASKIVAAKEACHDHLPPYMVPTHFIPLTAMPLNVNNKADSRALRALYDSLTAKELQSLSTTANPREEVWSQKEQEIGTIVAGCFGVGTEIVDKNVSFFELGMDSISVIGVARALQRAGFSGVNASLILRHSSVRRLSRALSTVQSLEDARGSVVAAQQRVHAIQHRYKRAIAQGLGIETSTIEDIAPCTPLQQGMIARSFESDNGLYYNSFRFRLTKNVDEERLKSAWQTVCALTPILRTTFMKTEDGYVQAAVNRLPIWSTYTAAEHQTATDVFAELKQDWLERNREELRQPLETVLVKSSQSLSLVIFIFHGLYDGHSMGLIFKSLWDAYHGRLLQNNVPSFYSALAHGPLRRVDGARKFWKDHFSVPFTSSLPALVTSTTSAVVVSVAREIHALKGFTEASRHLNVTPQAIAQACWLNVLHHRVGVALTTGILVAGRSINLVGAEDVVGPMFNTIPYYHRSRHGETWASHVKRVHEFSVAAHPYQHTQLRDIMKWCGRNPSEPLFDCLFVFQTGQTDHTWAVNDVWEILDGEDVADYPLAFEVEHRSGDDFKVTLITQGHISDAESSNKLLDQFEDSLRRVLMDPQSTANHVNLSNGAYSNVTEGAFNKDLIRGSNNGAFHSKTPTDGAVDMAQFTWSEDALKIREEIASICGVAISDISASTSIFELGLDSIDGIKLSSRLRTRNVNLSVSAIMRNLTISRMAQNIRQHHDTQQECLLQSHIEVRQSILKASLQNLNKDCHIEDDDEVLPSTPLQEAMIAEMIASDYAKYFNFDVLNLHPDTDISRLKLAFSRVVDASPILRTTFVEVVNPDIPECFAQVVRKKRHDFWSEKQTDGLLDFSKVFEECRLRAIASEYSEPLFYTTLVKTSEKAYLVIAIAHALYDGWSLGLLHEDVHRAYYDRYQPRPGFSATLDVILASPETDASIFWQDYLADAKASTFPRQAQTEDKSPVTHRIEHKSTTAMTKIVSFAKRSNVSLQTLGQTVFAVVLACYARSLDVTFGSVLSGRDDDEAAQLLFPTMNTVAIRVILHGSCTELLQYVQANFNNIKQWQHYPLRRALSAAGVPGALFEGLFIYQKRPDEDVLDEQKLYSSVEGHSDVEYPVCIEMETSGDDLIWRGAIKDTSLSKKGADELMRRLDDVLQFFLENPEASVIQIRSTGISVSSLPEFQTVENPHFTSAQARLTEHDNVQPLTPLACKIRGVLSTVSKIPEDGITQDMTIFHMGLDSITAIKVSSMLRKQDIVLSVGDMLRAGTVSRMAEAVDARDVTLVNVDKSDHASVIHRVMTTAGIDDAAKILQAGNMTSVDELLPVTAGQLYMLSMWLNSNGANFWPEFKYRIHGEVSLEGLQNAWESTAAAHPILRTRFISTGMHDLPYLQVVMRHPAAIVHDGQNSKLCKDALQTQGWARLTVKKTQHGWDAHIKIHHALYDGVSLPVLMQEFVRSCLGNGSATSMSMMPRFVASTYTEAHTKGRRVFWTKYLDGIKQQSLSLPIASPAHKTEVYQPHLLETTLLEAAARENGITVQSIFLAAYAKLYAQRVNTSRREDVIVGIYLANRSLPVPGIATAAIPAVNLLPLRIKSPLASAVLDVAAKIQGDLLEISAPANATTSLHEINVLTGVRVDTFVNFLSLPAERNEEGVEGAIGIELMNEWIGAISRTVPVETTSSGVMDELRIERVNAAYLHAIDVEATIRNGALDVGVFAPSNMLDLEDGGRLIEDLRRELLMLA